MGGDRKSRIGVAPGWEAGAQIARSGKGRRTGEIRFTRGLFGNHAPGWKRCLRRPSNRDANPTGARAGETKIVSPLLIHSPVEVEREHVMLAGDVRCARPPCSCPSQQAERGRGHPGEMCPPFLPAPGDFLMRLPFGRNLIPPPEHGLSQSAAPGYFHVLRVETTRAPLGRKLVWWWRQVAPLPFPVASARLTSSGN